jgi:hypothetical protein
MDRNRFQKRILDRCVPVTESGCWLWTASCYKNGYGSIWLSGKKNVGAHRLSYMAFVGDIPSDMFVCHKCDVKFCVNPDHLFLGSNAENIRDCVSKGLFNAAKGERSGNAKLTRHQVVEIREKYSLGDITHRQLAKEYGVSHAHVFQIIHRARWGHI